MWWARAKVLVGPNLVLFTKFLRWDEQLTFVCCFILFFFLGKLESIYTLDEQPNRVAELGFWKFSCSDDKSQVIDPIPKCVWCVTL